MRRTLLAVLAALACTAAAATDVDRNATNPTNATNATSTTTEAVLSRRRRYVVFPRGSSIQLVAEFTVGSYVPLTTIFTSTLTWGLAWRLPTRPAAVLLQRRSAEGEDPDRPHRQALARDLAALLDRLGMRGEHSIKRTLCDLHDRRAARGSFMEEILKALFLPPDADQADADGDARTASCQQRHPHGTSVLDLPIRPAFF